MRMERSHRPFPGSDGMKMQISAAAGKATIRHAAVMMPNEPVLNIWYRIPPSFIDAPARRAQRTIAAIAMPSETLCRRDFSLISDRQN